MRRTRATPDGEDRTAPKCRCPLHRSASTWQFVPALLCVHLANDLQAARSIGVHRCASVVPFFFLSAKRKMEPQMHTDEIGGGGIAGPGPARSCRPAGTGGQPIAPGLLGTFNHSTVPLHVATSLHAVLAGRPVSRKIPMPACIRWLSPALPPNARYASRYPSSSSPQNTGTLARSTRPPAPPRHPCADRAAAPASAPSRRRCRPAPAAYASARSATGP